MLKSGGAVIHRIKVHEDISYLVGHDELLIRPLVPYHPVACDFLNDLSSELRSGKDSTLYPDIMAFAFWCRKANIEKNKICFGKDLARIGLGLVFHIAPSNVPINFAFSWAFGLLAGNANLVRVPSKQYPQIDIVCEAIDRLLALDKYSELKGMNVIVKYGHHDEINRQFSADCHARIIWGGDSTINTIRKFPIPHRSVDIAFADRYSFCIIHAPSLVELDHSALSRLARNFYNDTYLMDQNACSSPHLIVWVGKDKEVAQEKFWNAVSQVVAHQYDLMMIHAVDKYTQFCHDAVDHDFIRGLKKQGSYVYRMQLDRMPANMDTLRGKYGYFYEYETDDINYLAQNINTKYQTLTYFGMAKSSLLNFIVKNRLLGVDRIVPIGKALDIHVIWDGYSVIESLSRIIDVE